MAGEVIKDGDYLGATRAFLIDRITQPVHVIDVPNPRPPAFVVIEPAGGNEMSITHGWKSIIVDCWGKTKGEAFELARDTGAYLKSIRNDRLNDVLLYKANRSGDIVWMPDPDAKVPRYRQIFQILTRGEAI